MKDKQYNAELPEYKKMVLEICKEDIHQSLTNMGIDPTDEEAKKYVDFLFKKAPDTLRGIYEEADLDASKEELREKLFGQPGGQTNGHSGP